MLRGYSILVAVLFLVADAINCPEADITITVPYGTKYQKSGSDPTTVEFLSNEIVPNDECKMISCGEHGDCFNAKCRCKDGYTGDMCTLPPKNLCENIFCNNNGQCADGKCVCSGGYTGELCTVPPKTSNNGKQVVYDSPIPKAPVVAYVGGSNYDGTFSFASTERLSQYDFLILGFVSKWNVKCGGPTEDGLNSATPSLNTNGCIPKVYFPKPPGWDKCEITDCSGSTAGTVGESVLQYQKRGGRLLISLGGANSDSNDMNPNKGTALAKSIWNMYLGGNDNRYSGWRPFGDEVVLDGVDLDLEQSPNGCPLSQQCLDVAKGWYNFVKTMRELMDGDSRKKYLITMVPINTKYADPTLSYPGYGAYTYGYLPGIKNCEDLWSPLQTKASTALSSQPTYSVYNLLSHVDFLWPQFYPSPVDITLNSEKCFYRDLLAWTNMCIYSSTNNGVGRCRVGVGLPFSSGSANGGQIPAGDAIAKISQLLQQYKVLGQKFGGVFGWDEFWDHTQNGGQYSKTLSELIHQPSFQKLIS